MNSAQPSLGRAIQTTHQWLLDVLLIVLGSLAIGILAQIAVPVGPVPVTGQTLGVLAVAVALGARRGALAIVLYLAQGVAGMPVFAGGTAGIVVLMGPTAGYLIGFIPAGYLIGLLVDRFEPSRPSRAVIILAGGTAVIYAMGAAWLARFVGWDRVVAVGVVPFLFGDALKVAIVALATDRLRGRNRR